MIEAQEGLVSELEFRLCLLDDDDVLYPYTELAVFVVPGLIRDDIAG